MAVAKGQAHLALRLLDDRFLWDGGEQPELEDKFQFALSSLSAIDGALSPGALPGTAADYPQGVSLSVRCTSIQVVVLGALTDFMAPSLFI